MVCQVTSGCSQHNIFLLYSYKTSFPKPRILLICPEKQGLGFGFAFGFVSFKGTNDEKLKAYIAGKVFLFEILEFQK